VQADTIMANEECPQTSWLLHAERWAGCGGQDVKVLKLDISE